MHHRPDRRRVDPLGYRGSTRRPVDRAPLVRFVPLQHIPAATRAARCCHAPGRSRFGVSSPPTRAASGADLIGGTSPVRFFAVAEQGGVARRGGRAGVVIRSAIDDHSSMTKFPSSFRSSCGWARGNRAITLTGRSDHIRASPLYSAVRAGGHAPSRFLRRGVPLPVTARTFAAWPDDWVLPSSSPGGAHGVWLSRPSQVCSRVPGGPCVSTRCRAHVPFASARPPRLIFVGVIRLSPAEVRHLQVIEKGRSTNRSRLVVRLLGFSSRLRSARRHGRPGCCVHRFRSRRSAILPWALPLSGFGTRSIVHRPGIRRGLRSTPVGSNQPERDPARFTSLRPVVAAHIGGAPTHPLVGFGTSFPTDPRRRNVRQPRIARTTARIAVAAAFGPSASLRG